MILNRVQSSIRKRNTTIKHIFLYTNIIIFFQVIERNFNYGFRCNIIKKVVNSWKSNRKIIGISKGETYCIEQESILYFETVDRKTFCYTADGVYEITLKLYEIEEKYENTDYIRISKSSIVNLNKIKSIRPDFGGKILATMENNEKIYISRQYVPVLKRKLGIGGN